MPDKTANWGVPGSGARYRTQDSDPTGGGNFVVAERLDSNGDPVDVLLEWDETAGEWVYGGPVNLDGGDVTNVGALDANSVSTGNINNDIVFASESITALPSIQSALDQSTQANPKSVIVVGGVNNITSTITFPDIDLSGTTKTIGLFTAKGSVIRQADNADLPTLVENDTGATGRTQCRINVSVDGNRANNSSNPDGVRIIQAGRMCEVTIRAADLGTALAYTGQIENALLTVHARDCDTAVNELNDDNVGSATQPPDECELTLFGTSNATGLSKNSNAYLELRIYSEGNTNNCVVAKSGVLIVGGVIRSCATGVTTGTGSPVLHVNGLIATNTTSQIIRYRGSEYAMISGCRVNDSDGNAIQMEGPGVIQNTGITNNSTGIRIVADGVAVGVNQYNGNGSDILTDNDYEQVDTTTVTP